MECSNKCQPPSKKPREASNFKWLPELKPAMRAKKKAFYEWKASGAEKNWHSQKYMQMQLAKKLLRKQQREIAARERQSTYSEIMTASSADPHLFYKLVDKQRKSPHNTQAEMAFPEYIYGSTETEKWADFYEKLATPQNLPEFNEAHKKSVALQRLLISSMQAVEKLPPVSSAQVTKLINMRKNNKAADCFGVTGEHLKLASPIIVPLITDIVNRVMCNGKFPDDTKVGLSTPVPQKGAQVDPDKFRRITITSLIGKIIEQQVVHSSDPTLSIHQSKHQFGFTKNVPCGLAAMLLTESILHCKDTKQPIYVTFMDAKKAFDVVDHDSALVHLYNQGIHGRLWDCYDSLYTNITSIIKWQGSLSSPIREEQGIRQGAHSSTGIYKGKANPFLHKVSNHPCSLHIGYIRLGALQVADDLTLSSHTNDGTQELVKEAELDAAKERFTFSKTKTRVVTICPKSKQHTSDPCIKLNNTIIQTSTKETHLGIIRSCNGSNEDTIYERIKLARRTCYALMGAGLHGLNGVGPEVAKKLWSTYVMPRLMYGLEALVLSPKEVTTLEDYYLVSLRAVQVLPKATARPASYLLLGVLPLEAQWHINTLVFFASALRRPGSIERDVIQRQLVMKDESSLSWVWHVQKLLYKYSLPSAFELLQNVPEKLPWKKAVKKTVYQVWLKQLKRDAHNKSTLAYINLAACNLQDTHPVWQLGAADTLTVIKATTKAKLLVQRYPLYYSRTSGNNYGRNCPLCKEMPETLGHFLFHCPTLADTRRPHMDKLLTILENFNIRPPESEEEAVLFVLDPSAVCYKQAQLNHILEHRTRDLCFSLHHKRSSLLGYPSRFKNTSSKCKKNLLQR